MHIEKIISWLGIQNVFAEDPVLPAGSAPLLSSQSTNPLLNLVPFALMFGVIYFLIIRPQQKRLKDTPQMLMQLKIGDEVITNSGMIGVIASISDKIVTLEVTKGVEFKFLKAHIGGIFQSQNLIEKKS